MFTQMLRFVLSINSKSKKQYQIKYSARVRNEFKILDFFFFFFWEGGQRNHS